MDSQHHQLLSVSCNAPKELSSLAAAAAVEKVVGCSVVDVVSAQDDGGCGVPKRGNWQGQVFFSLFPRVYIYDIHIYSEVE